jgi:hypothetical protein
VSNVRRNILHSREKLRIGPSIDRISFLLLVASPLTTIAVSPFYNYDPINLIKLLVCTSVAFATLGIISANGTRLFSRIPRNLMMSAAFFVLWMLVAMLVSEAPLSQEFWGVFGRNSGFLTYFSLIVLLLSSALVQTEKFYANLIRSFVLTSFPLTLYALIQLVGMDPIAWSQMAPFATLGNINFSSAFFGLASIVQGVLVLHSRTSGQLKV